MTEQIVDAPYKYTFPITKAFVGTDGRARLIGAATGPEIDLQDQRVAPTLIDKWIRQINDGEITVGYDDNHKTTSESITSELGEIEKAWKDEQGHMIVQVVLDEANPVSQYIHKSAKPVEEGGRGKKYGMSIYGKATRFIDEIVSNKKVLTIIDGTLERIAHTTRPVWTPSFGTVLSKAVEDAVNGETQVADNETETVDKTEVTTDAGAATTDSGAATAPDTGKAPDAADGSATADADAGNATVEKSVRAETKKDQKALDGIVKTFTTLGAQLREAGLLVEDADKGAEGSTEKTVEKSDKSESEDDRIVTLEKSLTELAKLVTSLADHIPDGSAPGSLRKSEPVDPLAELRAIEDPMERLRMGLAAAHGSQPTLR